MAVGAKSAYFRLLIKILGTAAGGGFPQWNCACRNCVRVRIGQMSGPFRLQTQLAVRHSGTDWALVNASPDLRAQLESHSELLPRERRASPITDVVLTGADVDQVLGLLLLREFHAFHVYATASVRRILCDNNIVFRVLARNASQVQWKDIASGTPFALGDLQVDPFTLADDFPAYVPQHVRNGLNADEAGLGLILSSTGGKAAFMPSCGNVSEAVLERLNECDALFFDGTFWDDDEPTQIPGLNRSARQIGHMPISGADGSLLRLSGLTRPTKYFIHVNNTNPILDAKSDEHRQVLDGGWQIAEDGMEINL